VIRHVEQETAPQLDLYVQSTEV